jgi:peroxiredoxin
MDNFDVSGALATGLHVLCFIPGAATPTYVHFSPLLSRIVTNCMFARFRCSSQIPAYLQETEKFKSHNVDAIYVVTVNDAVRSFLSLRH